MRKPFIPLIVGISLIISCIGVVIHYLDDVASLEIANSTHEIIRNVHLVVWEYQYDLGDIAPKEKRQIKIDEYSDSSWNIEGLWPTGEHFSGSYGYITHGMSFSDRIVFGANRTITFSQKNENCA